MAIEIDLPIFAVCRGFQELNVALGGTIYPYLHEIPGRFDHRRDRTKSIEYQMSPSHSVEINQNGLIYAMTNKKTLNVNSLHGQGLNKLGKNILVEAIAKDSTIEAISLKNYKSWALGVQWHPELNIENDFTSKELFVSYGLACKKKLI